MSSCYKEGKKREGGKEVWYNYTGIIYVDKRIK